MIISGNIIVETINLGIIFDERNTKVQPKRKWKALYACAQPKCAHITNEQ
jgi:hypothetical protein